MKNRLISASAAVCLSLAAFAGPASADLPITINAGYGYWFFDREVQGLEPDDNGTPVLGAEYAFTDNWSAEFLVAHDETEFEDGTDTDITTWQLGGLYYIGAPAKVRPYLAFGAGEIELEADQFDTVETTLNAGGGVRWMFNDRVGARIDSRAIYSVDESDTDFLVSASLSFYLGDVAAAAPAAALVAAGPVDSDGDGVMDDRDRCPDTPAGTRVDADGCPLAVAQVASVKLKVNFAYDSSAVQTQYFDDLSELATFLKRFEDVQVEVEGHTDSQGSADYNQGLSQSRAQAVVNHLVNTHGIERSRLMPRGYGESRPVASNETEAGRAENRRVMATLEVEYEN
ncbi:MAG: OmpA family protein [Halioglobus sp.]